MLSDKSSPKSPVKILGEIAEVTNLRNDPNTSNILEQVAKMTQLENKRAAEQKRKQKIKVRKRKEKLFHKSPTREQETNPVAVKDPIEEQIKQVSAAQISLTARPLESPQRRFTETSSKNSQNNLKFGT
jgi:hypothetical protein